MTRSARRAAADASLAPRRARHSTRSYRLRRRARPGLGGGERRRRFLTGLLGGGFDSALAAAGATVAEPLADRMHSAAFRRAWEAADAARLRLATTLLTDRLLEMLRDRPDAAADRALVALWQLLREGRAAGAAGKAPALPVPADAPVAAAGGDEDAEILALIAAVEADIAAAEAELGLAAGPRP